MLIFSIMKKRLVILIILFLFLLSSNYCFALINVEENLEGNYNLGDTIITKGYFTHDKDINADFRIKIICEQEETLLMIKRIFFVVFIIVWSSFVNANIGGPEVGYEKLMGIYTNDKYYL